MFRKQPTIWSLLLVAVALVCCAPAAGQDQAPKTEKPREAKLDHEDVAPKPLSSASLTFVTRPTPGSKELPRELRTLLIHQSAMGGGVYFIRPKLSMRNRTEVLEQYPDWILEVDETSDSNGHVLVVIGVSLFSDELIEMGRDAVLDPKTGDRTNALKDGRTEDDVEIRPWPLKHLVAVARNKNSKEILAVAESSSLTGRREELELAYKFTPENFEKFLQFAQNGRLEFVYYYTYKGVKLAAVEMIAKGEINVQLVFDEVLSSEQKNGEIPVFQGQRGAIVRRVAMRRFKVIRGNQTVVPFLDTDDIGLQIFEPAKLITFEELKSLNPAAEAQLAKYLQPHLETLKENLAKMDVEIVLDEKGKARSEENSAGFSIGKFGASGSEEKLESELARFEKEHGVTFQKVLGTERFVPHRISASAIRKGQENISFDDRSEVCFDVGAEQSYLEETPISMAFTDKVAADELSDRHSHAPYEAVRIGTILPFVGTRIPEGYLLIDPKNAWPLEDWVPVQLRGRPMPDLSSMFVGGTVDIESVGQVFQSGQISIEGKSFSVAVDEQADRETYGLTEHCLTGNFGKEWTNKCFHGTMINSNGEGYLGKTAISLVPQTPHKYRDKLPGAVGGEQTVKLTGRETLSAHFPVRWMVRVK